MSVPNFIAQMNKAGGFANQNRYLIDIHVKNLLHLGDLADPEWNYLRDYAGVDSTDSGGIDSMGMVERLIVFCYKAEIPGYQFATDEQRIYGPAWKFPHQPEYQECTFGFYVGADMLEKYFFEGWMYQIMDPTTNDFNYIGDHMTDIDIYLYDETMEGYVGGGRKTAKQTYWTTMFDAYPISMNAIQLGWDNNDQIMKMDITFTYKVMYAFEYGSTTNSAARGKRERMNDTVTES